MSCIFCTIYESNKSNILFESENSFVIVDRYPMSKGHLLVIPKVHRSYLHEYKKEELSDVLDIYIKMVNKYNIKRYNLLQNNDNYQSVYHVHFHIIPCNSELERLKIDWTHIKMDDSEFKEYCKNNFE